MELETEGASLEPSARNVAAASSVTECIAAQEVRCEGTWEIHDRGAFAIATCRELGEQTAATKTERFRYYKVEILDDEECRIEATGQTEMTLEYSLHPAPIVPSQADCTTSE